MRVNPRNYGANGIDDGPAFVAAINALPARGGIVDIEGDFTIASAIPAITKPVYFRGEGAGCCSINVNGSFGLFTFSGQNRGWGVEDVLLTGTTGTAILSDGAPNGVVSGIRTSGFGTAVSINRGQGMIVEKSQFWKFTQFGVSLWGNANNDIHLSKLLINGQNPDGTAGLGHGLRMVDKCEAIVADGVGIILCKYPMSTDATSNTPTQRPAYSRFTSCFFDSCSKPALINKCSDFVFMGCEFANRPDDGLVVTNSDGVTFIAPFIGNSGANGAIVDASAKNVRFIESNVVGNILDGIVFGAGTTDFSVVGGMFKPGWGFPGAQAVAVRVLPGSSNQYSIVGLDTAGTLIVDGGTGTNKWIAGNH